ncbi:MAG: hypothetical protein K1W37_02355 [Lachnospiraceae bacterium]|jgi:hypothetical protein
MRIDANYNSTNLMGVNSVRKQDNQCFSEIMRKKADSTDTYEKQREDAFKPSCSEEVMQAYDKTLKDTGIDPFPMNRISTALVIHVEQGKEQLSSDFLGNTVESAKAMVKKILERIYNPISPPAHPDFVAKEREFYEKFLDNLNAI